MQEKINQVNFEDEVELGFLRYSMSVITDRALPDVRDGLKPVHRRIIYDMQNLLKLKYNKPYVKSAKVVGDVMGQLHPHGDSSIYDAACRMSLDFIMRYPLIDGQGNFGSIDGDGAAASRYTEMRPKEVLNLMVQGINENAVNMNPNFSEEILEPEVLPSIFPNLLVNGTTGIAVGMACSFLPNNLTEVCNALIAFIDAEGQMNDEDVMAYIQGPDFPNGGTIINKKDIAAAYRTGKSTVSLKIRGDYIIDGDKIIFTSIPYGVTKDKIREQFNKHIDEFETYFSNFEDNSDKNGIAIEFTMNNKENVEACLSVIFKYTKLQNSVSVNNVCLVNGAPKQMSVLGIIKEYVSFNNEILIRRNRFKSAKYIEKINVVDGLIIALSSIDLVINLIRNSKNKKDAKNELIKQLEVNEQQADAILDMRLSKLTKLDEMDLKKELEELKQQLSISEKIINNEQYRNSILKDEIIAMREKYGDARRTKIEQIKIDTTKLTKKIENVDVIISTDNKNVKIVKSTNVKGRTFKTNTSQYLIAFCDDGNAYKCSIKEIKNTNSSVKALTKAKGEVLCVATSDSDDLIYQTTRLGMIKISAIKDFNSARASVSIKLNEGDKVVAADVGKDFNICTQNTNSCSGSMDISDLKVQGKATKGVKGLKLVDGDMVISASFGKGEPNCKRNSKGHK